MHIEHVPIKQRRIWATSHINLQKSKQLYQEEDQYGCQINIKKQQKAIAWRKQLLLHIKGPQE